MKKKIIHGVVFALAILPISILQSQVEVEVNPNMLLWKIGRSYRTQVNAEMSLTNTTIKLDLPDRKGKGSQNTTFHYQGKMAYNTEAVRESGYNGAASRYYEQCDILKCEADPATLKVDAGYWEVWWQRLPFTEKLPPEWQPYVEVAERDAWNNFIILKQKPGSPNLLGADAFELAFQSLRDLSKKMLLLEWPRIEAVKKAKLSVYPAEVQQKRLVKTSGSVSNEVKDVLGRETKLLYEAMLGFNDRHQDGDVWIVDGETLDAIVHPAISGHFRGNALVKAESVRNESPNKLVSEMSGFKLKFVPRGIIDGKSCATNLSFVVETVDGGSHETNLAPDDKTITGEIWLDTDNQAVRYCKLKVEKTKYNGYLPKIGKLNAKIQLNADFNFEFSYVQSITQTEKE